MRETEPCRIIPQLHSLSPEERAKAEEWEQKIIAQIRADAAKEGVKLDDDWDEDVLSDEDEATKDVKGGATTSSPG